MNVPGLTAAEVSLLLSVFQRHPEISAVKLFGSRARGTHKPYSDIDLALWGELDDLGAERIATELDELPLPYRFDVLAFATITVAALREHIEQAGIPLYPVPAA